MVARSTSRQTASKILLFAPPSSAPPPPPRKDLPRQLTHAVQRGSSWTVPHKFGGVERLVFFNRLEDRSNDYPHRNGSFQCDCLDGTFGCVAGWGTPDGPDQTWQIYQWKSCRKFCCGARACDSLPSDCECVSSFGTLSLKLS